MLCKLQTPSGSVPIKKVLSIKFNTEGRLKSKFQLAIRSRIMFTIWAATCVINQFAINDNKFDSQFNVEPEINTIQK